MSLCIISSTSKQPQWCGSNQGGFRYACVLKAVNLGSDTDTVGAVAGGLAGIIYGIDEIPREWIDKLQAKSVIEESFI